MILINERALGTNVDSSPTRLLLSSKNMYTNTIPDCHPYPKYGATHFKKVATVPLQVCTACNKRHAERNEAGYPHHLFKLWGFKLSLVNTQFSRLWHFPQSLCVSLPEGKHGVFPGAGHLVGRAFQKRWKYKQFSVTHQTVARVF